MTKHQKPSGTISLFEAAKLTGYHQDYLGQLCRAGKISALKVGRNWYTTEQAITTYFGMTDGAPAEDILGQDDMPSEVVESYTAWELDSSDEDNRKSIKVDKHSRKHLRKFNLSPSLAMAVCAFIGLLFAATFLVYGDKFLGSHPQTAVRNYDSNSKTFHDTSVAGAVDEPIVTPTVNQVPSLKPIN